MHTRESPDEEFARRNGRKVQKAVAQIPSAKPNHLQEICGVTIDSARTPSAREPKLAGKKGVREAPNMDPQATDDRKRSDDPSEYRKPHARSSAIWCAPLTHPNIAAACVQTRLRPAPAPESVAARGEDHGRKSVTVPNFGRLRVSRLPARDVGQLGKAPTREPEEARAVRCRRSVERVPGELPTPISRWS